MSSMPLLFRDFVLEQVVAGELRPGKELHFDPLQAAFDEAMAKRLSASDSSNLPSLGRSTYRSVIEELADLQILNVTAGAVPEVRQPTREDVLAQATVRTAIETLCVYRIAELSAAERHQATTELVRIHNDLNLCARKRAAEDTFRFVLTDWNFHRSLCTLSGFGCAEPTLSRTFWSFILNGRSQSKRPVPDATSRDIASSEHKLILSAMMLGKSEAASMAMRYHILTATQHAGLEDAGVAAQRRPASRQEVGLVPFSTYKKMAEDTRILDKAANVPFSYKNVQTKESEFRELDSVARCFLSG